MVVEYSEFKGNPVIELKRNKDDNYAFRFGLTKAKLILSHIEEIKNFVENNGLNSTDIKFHSKD